MVDWVADRPGRRCIYCSPVRCKEKVAFIYVVKDIETGLVKIGQSVDVSRRLQSYIGPFRRNVVLVQKWPAGCGYTAAAKEAKALRRLDAIAHRERGDWFHALPEQAVECVEASL